MLHNTTKEKLAAGDAVFGCFVRYREPSFAEIVAMQGWDFVVFDGEHGMLEPRNVEDLCRAVELRGATPLARVTTNQPHIILRYLDTGIHGVHVPWVNTAAGVEDAVTSVKYWPRGQRGLAGSRASDWGQYESLAEYTERANRETMVVVHIETQQAVDAIDEYVAIDGVDVLFIGPTDLSHSLGHPGNPAHADVERAMLHVTERVVGSDKTLGIFAGTADVAERWLAKGARYLVTSPEGFMKRGMHDYLTQVRS